MFGTVAFAVSKDKNSFPLLLMTCWGLDRALGPTNDWPTGKLLINRLEPMVGNLNLRNGFQRATH
jgi:hypothetical protein